MAEPKTAAENAAYAASLRDAETKAEQMFIDIAPLIQPGITDKQLSEQIHRLGQEKHGVRTHWHKRIVRSGPNTLRPFEDNPPDRTIEADDILVVDLGPVFEEWEADFGRTYVLGNDPAKIKLRDTLEVVWKSVKKQYDANPTMTGEELYAIAVKTANDAGYEWGAQLAGHNVGDFPHERIPHDKIQLYITKGNTNSMQIAGKRGFRRHWILEVYLRGEGEYQGFYEQLLTA